MRKVHKEGNELDEGGFHEGMRNDEGLGSCARKLQKRKMRSLRQ